MRTTFFIGITILFFSFPALAKSEDKEKPADKNSTSFYTRKLNTVKAVSPSFNTPGKYLEYKRKLVVEGKDSARVYARINNQISVVDYLPLTGGNIDGILNVTHPGGSGNVIAFSVGHVNGNQNNNVVIFNPQFRNDGVANAQFVGDWNSNGSWGIGPNGGYGTGSGDNTIALGVANGNTGEFDFTRAVELRLGNDYVAKKGWSNSTFLALTGGVVSGTLGIGTGSTSLGTHTLGVNGSGIFTEVVVKTFSAWPDYVFDKTYKLKSLDEVAKYIEENNHLPNIPSSADMKKSDGIELGQMNTKLLEKIEEITLYLIELKKENTEMNKQIQQLKKELKTKE